MTEDNDLSATCPGYLYVVQDTYYCKVGMSKNHPSGRARAMQTGNKTELRLAFYAPVNPGDDLAQREAQVHTMLDPHRIRGEWFAVTPLAAAHAICDLLGIDKPVDLGQGRHRVKKAAVPRLTTGRTLAGMSLTNTAIDALQPGERLKDDRVPGLEVRANTTGKSFLLYYRTRLGVIRRPKIGSYPIVPLAAARDLARTMLLDVASGRDPMEDRAAARIAPNMDALWVRCEEEHYSTGADWDAEAKRAYYNHMQKSIGKTKVASIDIDDIKAIHRALAGTPTAANRTLAVASKMLSLAEEWKYRPLGSNPCQAIARYPEKKRRRYATPDEIRRIGACLDKYAADPEHVSGVAFLALLMFSGARPSEIANATPNMVERRGAAGVLRLAEAKTGPRDVFLPPQAMAVLDRLPASRARLSGRATVPRALWDIVVAEADCPGLWARDLRRTFATVALSGGTPLGVVGELLGHASTQTTKIYAKLIEDSAHAAAAGVAERMQRLISGGSNAAAVAGGDDPFD